MNIAIVDDSRTDIGQLSELLREYASINHLEIRIDGFQNPREFTSLYTPYKYTLVFLDIYMNEISGVAIAEKIRKEDCDAAIVFLTTSPDHMPEAFSLHAYDYILKPADKKRVFRMLDDITKKETKDGKLFSFADRNAEHHLRYSDIMVIRSNSHYLQIIDKDMTEYKTRMTFSEAAATLSGEGRFLTINRGMLINMDHVTSFSDGICVINGSIYLPYNVKKHKELEQTYRNYIFSQLRQNTLRG